MSTFRITTNGMFRNYRSNLMKNNKRLNDTITDVQTQRKFNTYAEDPASASRAWRQRRAFWRTNDQIDGNNYIISKYESASAAMHAIVDGDVEHPGLDGLISTIAGVSDTAGASRVALGRELFSTSESIVSMMNSKYGDDFIFAGADGVNIPFQWDGDKLLYRGHDVSVEQPEALDSSRFGFTKAVLEKYGLTSPALDYYDKTKADIESINVSSFTAGKPLSREEFAENLPSGVQSWDAYSTANPTATEDEYKTYLDGKYSTYQSNYVTSFKAEFKSHTGAKFDPSGSTDAEKFNEAKELYDKLEKFETYTNEYAARNNGASYAQGSKDFKELDVMANEATYMDIGLGLKEDSKGELIKGSAFNSAISGLNFLGYGKDNNIAVTLRELGSIFLRCDPETGDYGGKLNENGEYEVTPEEDRARASELLDLLHKNLRDSQGQHVKLETDAKYLKENLQQLETTRSQLNEQIKDTESLDPADAITEMTWAQYCYNAALRIGTNLLSQSLIDYLS